MVLVSPGIEIKEIELTRSIDVSDQTIAFVPIPAVKGPLDKVLYINSRKELVDLLGEPNGSNYEYWFAGATIIQYGGILATYRPSTDQLNSATDTGVNELVKNYEDYYERKGTFTTFDVISRSASDDYNGLLISTACASQIAAYDALNVASFNVATLGSGALDIGVEVDIFDGATVIGTGTIVAINTNDTDFTLYVGFTTAVPTVGIGDEVQLTGSGVATETATTASTEVSADPNWDVWDVMEYAPGKKWSSLYIPRPATSEYGTLRNIPNDEVHVIIVDELGTFSGVAGSILEKYIGNSKEENATGLDGISIFYKQKIETLSDYIYFVGDATLAPLNTYTLQGGSNYDFTIGADLDKIESAVLSSLDVINDAESYSDIDFILTGKITAALAAEAIRVATERKDCMACISPERSDVVNSSLDNNTKNQNVVNFFSQFSSSSYAVFDNNYKYLYDEYAKLYRYVPCAADVAGLMINVTNNSESWFSPAGATRGNLRNAIQLAYNANRNQRDLLYTNRINPIVSIAGSGARLMGDKTALSYTSVFDRINVRRLFITLETFIGRFARDQLFEINDDTTRNNFRTTVEAYMRDVEARRGVQDFRVVCDTANNTQEVINRNEFVADIYIRPSRSINFIQLNFIATSTDIAFTEIV